MQAGPAGVRPDGSLSEMVNLTRAREAIANALRKPLAIVTGQT